jgi:hypothetical protein
VTEIEALLLSAAIEGAVAFLLVSIARWSCRDPIHVALASVLATAVTHPQFWAATLWLAPRLGYWPAVLSGESVVVLVEAAIIAWAAKLTPGSALVTSVAANGSSAAIGILLST